MNEKSPSPARWFGHEGLDAYRVARECLVLADALGRSLPRGYAGLADQLRRATLSAMLGIAEGHARSGADRLARLRCSAGEAAEAGAAIDAVQALGLAPEAETAKLRALLLRLCAMLTRLSRPRR